MLSSDRIEIFDIPEIIFDAHGTFAMSSSLYFIICYCRLITLGMGSNLAVSTAKSIEPQSRGFFIDEFTSSQLLLIVQSLLPPIRPYLRPTLVAVEDANLKESSRGILIMTLDY